MWHNIAAVAGLVFIFIAGFTLGHFAGFATGIEHHKKNVEPA